MEYIHKPVLLRECLDGLNIRPDGIYVDGTLGRAGHSLEIVKRLTTGRLIAIDRDVVVTGNNDRAQIWSADNWKAKTRQQLNPETIASLMKNLGI